jgi:hypothetical protein
MILAYLLLVILVQILLNICCVGIEKIITETDSIPTIENKKGDVNYE